ncbi:MAG: C4-dicarboxylate ABC transporter [marine bacterium B5-7]|nr:MAG: C4-dicarboxylate ABC transporter [marine bacterium B5-7]
MAWAVDNFVPILFLGLFVFLLSGFPVAFVLCAVGLLFGMFGIILGLFPVEMLQAVPLRIIGIMQNDTILAVPYFTFMGIVLQKSGIAEDLLETTGQVFGPLRGGLAISVIVVGALLAATTGVISAAVISMGLISLPVMLRYGYSRHVATGVIMASGSLAQIIPPSVILIVLADQLGRSVGDMFLGAMIPGLCLVGIYVLFVVAVAVARPSWVPAMPVEARTYREASGSSGYRSLSVLFTVATIAGFAAWLSGELFTQMNLGTRGMSVDIVISVVTGAATAIALIGIDRLFHFGWFSTLAVRVTLLLLPPLVLIFLVLGTVFLGLATPTEGGAMGAIGALVLAAIRRRLDAVVLRGAVEHTARLTCFVIFILIGASVFSLVFNAADGHTFVEGLFEHLPGGEVGFLVAVNTLVFFLGFFLDFFEIAFIVIPILAPIAEGMGIDLIWFGVLIAVNLQTSYLTPPFGFALFFLRNVAPRQDYVDRVTGARISRISTEQIYRGAVAFVVLQLVMIAILIIRPGLVTDQLGVRSTIDPTSVIIKIEPETYPDADDDPMRGFRVE